MNLYSLGMDEKVEMAKSSNDPQLLNELFEMYDKPVQAAIANNENIKYYYEGDFELTALRGKCEMIFGSDTIDEFIEEYESLSYSQSASINL